MEISQLKYAIQVAQEQNFSRAAEKLFITQPTLSQQIGKLEKELGLTLFERTTRSVVLTSAGKDFIEYALQVVQAWNNLNLAMEKHLNLEKGNITIGILPTLSQLGLTHHIVAFLDKYSSIKIEFIEAWSEELVPLLLSNKVDLAFLNPISSQDDHKLQFINFYPLVEDCVMLIVNNNHPFAQREFVFLNELIHMRMLMLTGHCSMRKTIDSVFNEHKINPLIVCECSSIDTLIGLIGEGMGVSFLTSKVALRHENSHIQMIPIHPRIKTFTAMALSSSKQHSPATIAFKNFILNNFKNSELINS